LSCPAVGLKGGLGGPALSNTAKVSNFDQLAALTAAYHFGQPALPDLEEIMAQFGELMQRLLEIQSGGRKRSAKLIEEDERLMDRLQKRTLAEKRPQTMRLSQDSPE
jgi:hypothetical protein